MKDKSIKSVFTVSEYLYGRHRVEGPPPAETEQYSFAESLSGLHHMVETIGAMAGRLGERVEVTMRVVPSRQRTKP